MSYTRSALLASLVVAAFGCKRHREEATKRTETAPKPVETYRPEVTGSGTAQPNGGGALGGAAVQGRTPQTRMRSGTGSAQPATGDAGTGMTNKDSGMQESPTPGATPSGTSTDTDMQPGTSDTSTQSTRPNPDMQEQGIGGGDTYDRNR